MNRKIKISIVTFISAFLLFSLTNIVSAWSPNTYFPIQEGNYTYFCREKDAGLRFFDNNIPPIGNGILIETRIDKLDSHVNDAIEKASDDIANEFKQMAGKNKAYKTKDNTEYNGPFEEWIESVNTHFTNSRLGISRWWYDW